MNGAEGARPPIPPTLEPADLGLRTNLGRGDLTHATLAELLIYAVSSGEEDLALGMLCKLREDLDAASSLCAASGQELIEPAELAGCLMGMVRRLEVAIEMLERRTVRAAEQAGSGS